MKDTVIIHKRGVHDLLSEIHNYNETLDDSKHLYRLIYCILKLIFIFVPFLIRVYNFEKCALA